MSSASYRQPGQGPPGEIEWKASRLRSPVKDYSIPAHQASSGRFEAFEDADLGAKATGARFDKVFGNAAFESDEEPPSPSQKQPGAIKMNNLFGNESTASRKEGPGGPAAGDSMRRSRKASTDKEPAAAPPEVTRGPSIIKLFRRGPSERPMAGEDQSGTMVQAFQMADNDDSNGVQSITQPIRGATTSAGRDRSAAAWEMEVKQMLAGSLRAEAVRTPAPVGGLVRCYVRRVKNFFGTHCSFQMHLQAGDTFLLAARRRKKSKVSSFVISQDLEDLKRDTDNCLAKLKANFLGTEYMLWGKTPDPKVHKGYAAEQMCVHFRQAALKTTSCPRAMYAALPLPEGNWQPSAPDGSDSLVNALELAKTRELPPYVERRMLMLCTNPPEYDEEIKGFALDFQGRVKEASVKNFQLVSWDHNNDERGPDVLLQFGKVEDDVFALDFAYPLSIQTAFAAALAALDTKLCYTL